MRHLIVFVASMMIFGCAGTNPGSSDKNNNHNSAATAERIISRDVLFGNPDRAQLRVSHDGKQVSFLAPVDGVLNIFVAPVHHIDVAKPVTHDIKRGIRMYQWSYNNQYILYSQDEGGNENWNIHAVDLTSGKDRNLTPNPKVTARILEASEKFPDEVLVAINDRNPQFHDVHRINVTSGADQLVVENPGMLNGGAVRSYVTDNNFNVRFAAVVRADGSTDVLKPGKPIDVAHTTSPVRDITWSSFTQIPLEDALSTTAIGFDKSGDVGFFQDSRERDTSALFAWNLKTNEKKLLAEDRKADVANVLVHPTEKNVQAVSFNYDRERWQVLDKSIQGDIDYLKSVTPGDINITSRSLDDKVWSVTYVQDNGPARMYLYFRDQHKAQFVFTNRKDLEGVPLAKLNPVTIKTRDGMDLVCYYTTPLSADPDQDGKVDHPIPMVLNVHGGPWARDNWGLNAEHQWLANRGYAVLSVNYRGSTGFGKKFINASNKEWAGKMHDDLLDAVHWAIDQKIADPKKIAIMGGSYGGYATLVGLTFTPDMFACGVDIVGPSNLYTLIKSVPPYWKPMIAQWRMRVGDETTDEGKTFLESRSPLSRVSQIQRPLLIGQGANDPRVKQAEADQIVKAMQEKNIPVTYILYPDEGHGFARPPNRISFFAVAEAFLAKHLGGRFEPIGDDFKGSSIQIVTGAGQVPGLKEAGPATQPTADVTR